MNQELAALPDAASQDASQPVHQLSRGGMWVLGSRVTTIVCTLATQFLLSHRLDSGSEESYGKFQVFVTSTLFFAILSMCGMNFAFVRLVADRLALQQKSQARQIYWHGFVVNSIVTTSLFFVVMGAALC